MTDYGPGNWYIYFNSANAAPLVWCVAPAEKDPKTDDDWPPWEVAVKSVKAAGCAETYYRRRAGEDPKHYPSAVLRVSGRLKVFQDGSAFIDAV